MLKNIFIALFAFMAMSVQSADVVLGIISSLTWQTAVNGNSIASFTPAGVPLKAVAWYKMDDNESSTDVIDSSTNGTQTGTATANTSTLHTNGLINGALAFSGTSEVSIPITGSYNDKGNLGLQHDESWSVSLWYKGEGTSGGLLSWNNNNMFAGLDLESGYATYLHYVDTGWQRLTSTILINDGSWHLIVFVNVNSIGTIYVDGQLDISGDSTISGYGAMFFQPGTIGGSVMNGQVLGDIDDVRIYDKALTQAEVTELYNGGNGLATELTVGHPPEPPPPPPIVITFDVQGFGTADFYENEYTIGQYFDASPYMPTYYPPDGYTWDGSWYDGNSNYYYSYSQVPSASVTLYPSYY
jgi:hypothetical protein